MCCAMTSPQHLVALPFASCTEPRCPARLPSAGGAVALQHTQEQGGTGMMMMMTMMMLPPLSQGLCIPISRVTCAPLTFCFSYAAVLYLAGRPGMLLSLGSRLLIRGKAPSRTKSVSRHLTASPVGQRITDSRLRLKVKITCLLIGLQNQCKTKIYNHNNNNNNNNRPGLEDLSIYCRAS